MPIRRPASAHSAAQVQVFMPTAPRVQDQPLLH